MIAALLAVTIAADQVGYPADRPKVATVIGADRFEVVREDGVVVLAARIRNQRADFSAVNTPGRYELRAAGARVPIEVAADPYREVLRMTTRAFYGQRCGTAVDLGGGYRHPACHLQGRFHESSGRKDARDAPVGGWHDAGDYGRYVVNSGISTATLLWAAERFDLDVLDEARWNVDWMLAMQDSDGGVWHKETTLQFADFVPPQADRAISYVIGKGSCATGDFAAVAAIAARVYRPSDAAFADRALRSAKSAYRWLAAHPKVDFRNPPDVGTGEYDDRDCSDERLWAAAEIFRTTGDRDADAFFVAHAATAFRRDAPPDWQNVGLLAAWTYAEARNADTATAAMIRERTLRSADAIVRRANRHRYGVPMRTSDYVWGSNGVAANYAVQLLVANAMRPTRAYVNTALEVIHYLLGRNAFGMSWVTGAGRKRVMHPHHRPSATDGIVEPWPGLLAGGPNRHPQDPVLRETGKTYIDDERSYASNEVAINWNAPLVFALSGIQKLQGVSRPEAGTVSRKRIDRRRMSATSRSTSAAAIDGPRRK